MDSEDKLYFTNSTSICDLRKKKKLSPRNCTFRKAFSFWQTGCWGGGGEGCFSCMSLVNAAVQLRVNEHSTLLDTWQTKL